MVFDRCDATQHLSLQYMFPMHYLLLTCKASGINGIWPPDLKWNEKTSRKHQTSLLVRFGIFTSKHWYVCVSHTKTCYLATSTWKLLLLAINSHSTLNTRPIKTVAANPSVFRWHWFNLVQLLRQCHGDPTVKGGNNWLRSSCRNSCSVNHFLVCTSLIPFLASSPLSLSP